MESKQFFINTEIEDVERYDLSKFLLFDNDVYDPFTSFIFNNIQKLPKKGQYIVQGDDGRPDRVSYKIYESAQYWWLILLFNNLASPEEIVHGQELGFPSIGDIEDLYFSLKVKQKKIDRED